MYVFTMKYCVCVCVCVTFHCKKYTGGERKYTERGRNRETERGEGRTKSGSEIDLETVLPKKEKCCGFACFYSMCFVFVVLVYKKPLIY